MQTAALLQKPMHLGEGFDNVFEDIYNISSDTVSVDDIFIPGNNVNYDFSMDYGADIQPAFIDSSGDASTASGQPLISANTLSQIAIANPGREAQAVAQSLQVTAPDWTKQFTSTDALVRAAAGLFSTVKAVVTGQPIPRSPTNPYVYGPGQTPAYRPATGLTTTHMLLIGGAALAAILLLRRK
jgi:hypothetical protein